MAEQGVRFSLPLSLWAEQNGYGHGATDPAMREFEVHQADPFIDWVLGLGVGAEILGPPEFVSLLLARAEIIRVAHEGGFVHGG